MGLVIVATVYVYIRKLGALTFCYINLEIYYKGLQIYTEILVSETYKTMMSNYFVVID